MPLLRKCFPLIGASDEVYKNRLRFGHGSPNAADKKNMLTFVTPKKVVAVASQ